MSNDFTPEQKRYLEGFVSGLKATGGGLGTPVPAGGVSSHEGPEKDHLIAQDKVTQAGGKLVDQEKWKRSEHPFDAYSRFKAQAEGGTYPKPEDNFRWRYHGLFYVAPAQNSYMCRLRIPNGILNWWQFKGVADLSETHGGGYSHVTTRANLQVREITADHAPGFIEGLADLGLTARGSGADNIRNVTGSSTAGIDPQELLDTRPHCKAWHNHILNDRSLYGLPRKFNVAFDGAGRIATLEDTNDIGFQAIEVMEGGGVEPGIWYRLTLGGITGHKDFARDTGVIVKPADAISVADAIVRVFIDHGDRTNRNKARLKYVLDDWGFERFLKAVEEKRGQPFTRIDTAFVKPRPAYDRLAHIGVHPQKQDGLFWIGLSLPVGKMSATQMRLIADLARDDGDGDIRLTVWQNLILSGIRADKVEAVRAALSAAGLASECSVARAGLIACTGSKGCKFAAADTKGHALAIADHLEARLELDKPVNIHLTGCHHSCAQHYIGDIGLIGAKVTINDEGDQVEGYHIHVGGGFGTQADIAKLIYADVRAEDAPARVEGLLRSYLMHRQSPDEDFYAFAARHDIEALKHFAESI